MPKLDAELERTWQEWKQARAKGLVKGEFPQAEELLKRRKGGAVPLPGYVPVEIEVEKKAARWPSPAKGQRGKRKGKKSR
jgi:hypothetical protein